MRRTFRSVLTLVALSTAVAAVVALVGISRGFSRSFEEVYSAHGIDIVVSRQGAADRLSSVVSQSVVDRIAQLEGVDRAAGLLLDTLSLETQGVYGIPTMGIQPQSWLLEDYELTAGRALSTNDRHVLLLGVHLASRLNLTAGASVDLFETPYEVAGIFQSQSTWENGSIIMPLEQLQELTDRQQQVTYVNVVLEPQLRRNGADAVIERIENIDAKLLALPTREFVDTDTRMQLAAAMAWMTSSIALLLGAVGMLNTMMTSVFERTREIGILRAIGWRKSRILKMILGEACVLSLGAAVAGTLIGAIITWAISRAPVVAGTITPVTDGRVILQAFCLALAIGLLGAVYPALRAARLLPTQALRHE